jgi:hypothetical protein
MLNVLTLIAWDGTRQEIDRRKVREAYVDRTSEDGAHTVVLKEDGKGTVHVGIGAHEEIEAWLGLKLPVLTVKDGTTLAGHIVGYENIAMAQKAALR